MEAEALTNWLYRRFVEKEKLLAHFYDTGLSDIQLSLILGQNICKLNYSAAAVCISSALPLVFEIPTLLFPMATHIGYGVDFKSPSKSLYF